MNRTKLHFTIEHLWGLVVIVGIFAFVNTHPIRPHDFWWHIAIGREILTTRTIPTTDIYSYTEGGQPYPSYQIYWLMEAILYGIYKLGGPALVVFLQSLMVTSAYLVILLVGKMVSGSWRLAAFGVLFAAALGINDWNVRPQGITFLLAALILFAIYKYKITLRWGWLVIIPISMVIWVNSHGTFVIGMILIGIWWGQGIWEAIISRIKQSTTPAKEKLIIPGLIIGISALACLINPQGLGIINYLKSLTSNSVVQNLVIEWAPPTFSTLMGIIFYCGLILSFILLVSTIKHLDSFQIATFIIFGLLSLRTSRGIVWFGMAMAPIVTIQTAVLVQRFKKPIQQPQNLRGFQVINIVFVVLIGIMGVISLPWFKSLLPLSSVKSGLISSETPIQATQVLMEKKLPGHIFNDMSFGSYLIWIAYPQYQVFVDSRIELFPENVWLDYLKISNAESDWESLLGKYDINTLLLSPADQPALIEASEQSGEWNIVYQDSVAVLLERK